MKGRIETMIPDEAPAIWISTFHSTCVRILRREIERIGFTRNFTICDYDDQLSLVKECIKELNMNDVQFAPKSVLETIGRAKDELIDPEGYLTAYGDNYYQKRIRGIYELYQNKLKRNNALDFDDIIMLTIKVFLDNEDVLKYYQNKFKYILVDEYQDTNTAQYNLITLLSGRRQNICVVGDDDQSIYGWRGANIANILGFEKDYVGARVIKLEQNYRSTKTILDAANTVIDKNVKRKRKVLWTNNESGNPIRCERANNEYNEAEYIARGIKRLRASEKTSWNDFAILYRINAQSRVLENVLIREGVPYRIIGGFKFFDRKEIKDVVAYLRLIQNTNDDLSMKRIINVPKRGIGATTVQKLENIARSGNTSLFEAAKQAGGYPELKQAQSKLALFTGMIDKLVGESPKSDAAGVFESVINTVGIVEELMREGTDEARSRIENTMELKSEILEFESNYQADDIFFRNGSDSGAYVDGDDFGAGDEAVNENGADGDRDGYGAGSGSGGGSGNSNRISGGYGSGDGMGDVKGIGLSEFLMHITLVADIDNLEEVDEKVTLMTVHSAKGLEFPVVFLAGMEEGVFPGNQSMTDSARLEEERRLCYVAITRAKKLLYITHAYSRTLFGNTKYNSLSRFIADIPPHLVEGDAQSEYPYDDISVFKQVYGYFSDNGGDAVQKKSFGGAIQAKNTGGIEQSKNTGGNMPGMGAEAQKYGGGDAVAAGMTYEIGERVRHKKYGEGTVERRIRDEGDIIIEISFTGAGQRRFIESMVNLQKL
jgi:DNA helicase-2/ATP-dependent DNA helicase PcrA